MFSTRGSTWYQSISEHVNQKFGFPLSTNSSSTFNRHPGWNIFDLTTGSQEAHDYQWRMESISLELMHDYKTERKLMFNFLNESF